jgi:hypothetical protein
MQQRFEKYVGPYDRIYHRNMLIDNNIISIWFWQLLGRDRSPVPPLGMTSTIYDMRQGESCSKSPSSSKLILF